MYLYVKICRNHKDKVFGIDFSPITLQAGIAEREDSDPCIYS